MKTLKTDREIFDFVKAHLLKQNKRATDANLSCLYRAPDGSKCAIGCLIPDELYEPDLEGTLASSFKIDAVLHKVLTFTPNTSELLAVLQGCHDQCWAEGWAKELDKIEHDYFGSPDKPTPS